MTPTRLCLRSLLYHWRGNLAVLLGVAVGSTVLTGALLVGDSLRGSLRDLALQRLGWVDQAMVAPRFFRQSLGDRLAADGAAPRVCPAILLQATASGPGGQARAVNVIAVDERFWNSPESGSFSTGAKESFVWLNRSLADDLGAADGEAITLRLQKPSLVPRESLLGRRDDSDVVGRWEDLRVTHVLGPGEFGERFNLRPEVQAPRNAFVPLAALQEHLGLTGKCNALLVAGDNPALDEDLDLDLEDWGLEIREPRRRRHAYLSLQSTNLLIEPPVADAAVLAARETDLNAAPTLVYLANGISAGGGEVPYSIVAALPPGMPPPLGPFVPSGTAGLNLLGLPSTALPPPLGLLLPAVMTTLSDDEIVLADWKASPLPRKPGTPVTLTYFPPEQHGDFHESTATFRLAGLVPLDGPAADPDLTPNFPGVTDKLTIDQWDPPFPFHNERVKDRDERYWDQYRTTPKAYVTLRKGQELWGSRFGNVTSIRLAPVLLDSPLTGHEQAFRNSLLSRLKKRDGGFVFQAVKKDALKAARGGTDFGMYFLGFSFFLIAAALLLVGLLFRLNLERRAEEVGLLAAVGYRKRTLRWLLLGEGTLVALAGSVVGALVALLYASLLLRLLTALWPGGGLQSFLRPHASPTSLAAGAGGSLVVSVLTIAWAVRSLGRVPPRALLAGQAAMVKAPGDRKATRWPWVLAAGTLAAAVVLLAMSGLVHDPEMRASTFFGAGALLLTACLSGLAGWMRGMRHHTVTGHGAWAVARLGVRNATRHSGRSLLTAGLLAAAAFLIVAVEAFRRSAGAAETSAMGGFDLVAESDLPLFVDLNTPAGRKQVLDKVWPVRNKADEEQVRRDRELLAGTEVVSFRVAVGDDASCLNLYTPTRPRVLGVPDALIDGDGFRFAATRAEDAAERVNPWLILRRGGTAIPAFGEKNTVQYMLHQDLGGEVELPPGPPLRIDGLLQDSVFQSSLLISEAHFLQRFPGHEGYNYFLIRTPPGRQAEVRTLLDRGLADRGFAATPVDERLASYLAVENTYLSTFQALGGLGLVLGSLGLAVVLLRGAWERRGELALLRALGYRRRMLGWLVLAENAFLLLAGLLAGTLSALAAVAPHAAAGAVPWAELLGLLAAATAVGLLAGLGATASTLRAPLVPALRRE
jgi:ABC-type antimicrobial peptide transport system permease subunit